MRKILIALFAATVVLTPGYLRADAIDDFVITGNGDTITFSLPASPPGNMSTCPPIGPISCLPGSETAFYISTPVTLDSVTSQQSIAFPTGRFQGGLSIGLDPGRLFGAQLFAPDAATPTFILGTYALDSFTGPIPATYTLTISAEDSITTTPEPGTLALLATGAGLFALTGIRRRLVSI